MGISRIRWDTQKKSGGRCRYTDIGDTHRDLRSAASLLSGD